MTTSLGRPTSRGFGSLAQNQNHDRSYLISSFRVLRSQMSFESVSSRKDNVRVLITFIIGRAVELRFGKGSIIGMSEKEVWRAPTEGKHRYSRINNTPPPAKRI